MQKTAKQPLLSLFFFSFLFWGVIACSPKSTKTNGSKNKNAAELPESKKLEFDHHFFSGLRHKTLGDYDPAIQSFLQALAIVNNNSTCMYLLGQCYVLKGKNDVALEWFQKAVAKDNENIDFLEALSIVQSGNKLHIESAETLKQLCKLMPTKAEYFFEQANQLVYAKKYTEALQVYDVMEKRFGINEEIIRQKEQLYLILKRPEKAMAEVLKLIKAYPEEVRYKGILAELYYADGKPDKALELYNEILKAEPTNGFAHMGLAEYYRNSNDTLKMIKSLLEAFKDERIAIQDKFNVLFSILPLAENNAIMRLHVFNLAETLVKVHPDNADVFAILGELNYTEKKYKEAETNFKLSLEINPANLNVWRQLCMLNEDQNDLRNLILNSEKALEFYPNQIMFYYFAASAHVRQKGYEYAVEQAQLGLGLESPETELNILLYSILGDALHNLERHDESDEAYEKAIKMDEKNVYLLNNYAYYLSLRKKDLEKAEKFSKKTILAEPNNASYLDTYGWILFQMDNYTEAKKYIKRSLAISSENSEVIEHLGDTEYKLNNKDEALKLWQKAFDLDKENNRLKLKIEKKSINP
jgi:tetratricopeptide (TPR) repeat protein